MYSLDNANSEVIPSGSIKPTPIKAIPVETSPLDPDLIDAIPQTATIHAKTLSIGVISTLTPTLKFASPSEIAEPEILPVGDESASTPNGTDEVLGSIDSFDRPSASADTDTSASITVDTEEALVGADAPADTSTDWSKRGILSDFDDFVEHYITQYHLEGGSFEDLPEAELLQLLDVFVNQRLDAGTGHRLKSADDRVKNLLLNTYTFAEFFSSLDYADQKQLIELLSEDGPPLLRPRKIEPPVPENAENEPGFQDLRQILGQAGTLDPFGMLALNEEQPEPEDTPSDYEDAGPNDLAQGSDPIIESAGPVGGVYAPDLKPLDAFGMTGLGGNIDDVKKILDLYFGADDIDAHADEDADIPNLPSENADLTTSPAPEPSGFRKVGRPHSPSQPAVPGKKFVDAVKVSPAVLNEVNGPFTGEMVKGKHRKWGEGNGKE